MSSTSIEKGEAARRFARGARIQRERPDCPETTTDIYDQLYEAIFERQNPPAIALRAKALAEILVGRPVTFIELLADDELKMSILTSLKQQAQQGAEKDTQDDTLAWLERLLEQDKEKSPTRSAVSERCYYQDSLPTPKTENDRVLFMFNLYYWFKKRTTEKNFDVAYPNEYLFRSSCLSPKAILEMNREFPKFKALIKEFVTLIINKHFMILNNLAPDVALMTLEDIKNMVLSLSKAVGDTNAETMAAKREYLLEKFFSKLPEPGSVTNHERARDLSDTIRRLGSVLSQEPAAYARLARIQEPYIKRWITLVKASVPTEEGIRLISSGIHIAFTSVNRKLLDDWQEQETRLYIAEAENIVGFDGTEALIKTDALGVFGKAKELIIAFQTKFIGKAIKETVSQEASDEQNARALKKLSNHVVYIYPDFPQEFVLAQKPYVEAWLARIDLSKTESPEKIKLFREVCNIALFDNRKLVEERINCSAKTADHAALY